MKLYHGSTVEIKEIDIAKSKPNKDFGRGFYLSADKQQAQRLAEYKAYQIGGNPVINVYDFDERLLTDGTLKVRRFDRYSKGNHTGNVSREFEIHERYYFSVFLRH